MVYYLTIEDINWANEETFESGVFPTLIGVKALSGIINNLNDQVVDKEQYEAALPNVGKIYIDGNFYGTPDEVPN